MMQTISGYQKAPLQIPFRSYVPSGTHQFSVRVPDTFEEDSRVFTFGYLAIAPDFFSLNAARQNLDEEQDMNQTVSFRLNMDVTFKNEKNYGAKVFSVPIMMVNSENFIRTFNKHFEANKDEFVAKTPVFFDWNVPTNTLKPAAFVELYAERLYNTTFENLAERHQNNLPRDIAKLQIEQLNDYLFPDSPTEDMLQTIRVRLFIMPKTRVAFSSNHILNKLGFTDEQIGERSGQGRYGQYEFVNNSNDLIFFQGRNPPEELITGHRNAKIQAHYAEKTIFAPGKIFQTTKKVLADKSELLSWIKTTLATLGDKINFRLNVLMDDTKSKFIFEFPSTDDVKVLVNLPVELSVALGLDPTEILSKTVKNRGFKSADTEGHTKKALALVFDTSVVLCTVDQLASNTTFGSRDTVLASLFPSEKGVMEYKPLANCFGLPYVKLAHFGQLERVQDENNLSERLLRFNLLRIYDDESIKSFSWRCGCYVYGLLISLQV